MHKKIRFYIENSSNMPVKDLLYVCTANVFRSPVAEGITKQLLEESNVRMNVESAGMQRYVGNPLQKEILDLAKRYGVDLSAHVPRQVDPYLINSSDLTLVFEDSQVIELEERFPKSNKAFTISEYSGSNDAYDKEDLRGKSVDAFEEFFKETRIHVKKCLERMKIQEQ